MEKLLPLFPLQLVVFPGEDLNLHIFEPRYKQLIKECEESGGLFGIPAFINGKVMDVGTEMTMVSIEKRYPNGEMDIKTKGNGIFRILEYYRESPGKLYAGAEVEPLSFSISGTFPQGERILELTRELFELLNIRRELPADPMSLRSYELAHHVGFTLEQEYAFLCIPEESERQAYLLTHLEKLLPTVREINHLKKKAQMNGHFKNILPPDL